MEVADGGGVMSLERISVGEWVDIREGENCC